MDLVGWVILAPLWVHSRPIDMNLIAIVAIKSWNLIILELIDTDLGSIKNKLIQNRSLLSNFLILVLINQDNVLLVGSIERL